MNFHKRTDNLLHQISLPSDLNLQGAIPKWHLLGHNPVCYYFGAEPGHRTDTLNNLAYEWNFEKMIPLAQHLPPKFKEAKRMLEQQKAAHLDLTASLLPDEAARPLMDPVWNDGQFQTVVRTEAAKESKTSRLPRKQPGNNPETTRKQPGAARWIADGIELEHRM
ncbi:hypothetical protein FRC09_004882 [Ceratobasidium sp. 395]|nr:hypothetical protein FRC09_004882 [Ceratobasidium sp. 395]